MLARLNGQFHEEDYQEALQVIEDPLQLWKHRFFTYQPLNEKWGVSFVEKAIKNEKANWEKKHQDPESFLKYHWEDFNSFVSE